MLDMKKGQVPKEELLKYAKDLLQETYRLQTHGAYRSPMDREATLINQIGILLRLLDRKEEAKELFYQLTEVMRNSKVKVRKRYRIYSLFRTNLAKWEQSVALAKENIQFTLDCGKLDALPINYMTVACALIDAPANRDICRDMIKDVYYLCEASLNDVYKETTNQYYKKKYGEEIS